MTFHPDRHMTATQEERLEQETKFKSISEAYNVLSDPEKRRKWEEGDDYDFAVPADFQEMLMKLFMQSFMGAAAAGGGGRGNRRGKGDPFASFFFGGGAFDFGGYDDDYGGGGRYYCESCGTYHDADVSFDGFCVFWKLHETERSFGLSRMTMRTTMDAEARANRRGSIGAVRISKVVL